MPKNSSKMSPAVEVGFVVKAQDYLFYLEGLPSVRIEDIIISEKGVRAIVTALDHEQVELEPPEGRCREQGLRLRRTEAAGKWNRMPVRAPVKQATNSLEAMTSGAKRFSMVRRTRRPRAGESGVGSNTGPICICASHSAGQHVTPHHFSPIMRRAACPPRRAEPAPIYPFPAWV